MRGRLVVAAAVVAAVFCGYAGSASATLHIVNQSSLTFVPADITITQGDTVRWVFSAGTHTVTSGTGAADPNVGALFDAPLNNANPLFEYVFTSTGVVPYFCRPHEGFNMRGTVTVDVASGVRTPASAVASLLPARPNPMGGETAIEYRLAEAGPVRLDVFDARGRHVATLENGVQSGGPHRAAWDGRDAAGALRPAGIYFVRLRAGAAVQTRKLVVVR